MSEKSLLPDLNKIPPKEWDEGDWMRLTPTQRKFLFEFSQCLDVKEACKRAGVSLKTFRHTWSRDGNFRVCFNEVQRDALHTIQQFAHLHAAEAFKRVLELMRQDEDKRVALQAAQTISKYAADPTLTGERKALLNAQTAWLQLFAKLAPALDRYSRRPQPVDAEYVYELPDKPDFGEGDVDEDTMAELDAKAKLLRLKGDE